MKKLILIVVASFVFISLKSQLWHLISKEVANDREANDYFGYSVAISGSYAVVGAYQEDPDTKSNAGAAYIFKNNNGSWQQVQKIVASDRYDDDNFGISVAINGNFLIVGAMNESHDSVGAGTASAAGSAYIFKNISGTWTQVKKIVPADRSAGDNFGCSVSISGDYVIVGAKNDQQDSANLNTLSGAGSAYIFKNFSGNWYPVKKLSAKTGRAASDNFGTSISVDGDYAAVGASGNGGAAYVFKNNNGTWYQTKITTTGILAGDQFGASVSVKGDYILIGAPFEDEDPNDLNTLTSAGSVYLFKNISGTWTQKQKVCADSRGANYNFGNSVSMGTNYFVVGAYKTYRTYTDAGLAYVYRNNSGTWLFKGSYEAPDASASDNYGCSVSLDGKYFISGAYLQDKDSTYSNSVTDAGAAYVIRCDTVQASNIIVSQVYSNDAKIDWTSGVQLYSAVFIKATNAGQASPIANTTYTADSKYKSGSEIGASGWYCIYKGYNPTVTVTKLVPNTTYRVMVCDYNNSPGTETYNTDVATNNPVNFTTPILSQTITLDTIYTKQYSSADSAVTAHSSVGLPVTITSSNENIVKIESGLIKIVGIGQCKVFARHPGNDTVVAAADSQIVTVIKSKLLVKGIDASREYGEANPALQISYTGFRSGETEAVIDTKPTVSTDAIPTTEVSLKEIQVSGGSDDHYYFAYSTGWLTVNKAPLTVTADNKSRNFGEANPPFTMNITGYKNSEDITAISSLPNFTCSAVSNSSVGTYDINVSGGSATNYSFNYVKGTLNVTVLSVNVTAQDVVKQYGLPLQTLTYKTVPTTLPHATIGSVTLNTTAQATSDTGVYPITASNLVLSSGNASNYSFTYTEGKYDIKPSSITVKADSTGRAYGNANPQFTYQVAGLKFTDAIGSVNLSTSASITSSVGNSYTIVPSSAVFSSGKASNYSINYVTGKYTITPAPLTITVENKTRLYGSSDPLFTFRTTGLKNNDSIKSLQITVASTTESDTGNYALSGSSPNFVTGQASNYSISYVDGKLRINPAPLNISMKNSAAEKLYGSSNPVFDFETTGLKNSDSISSITFNAAATNTSDTGTYNVLLSNAVFSIGKPSNYTINYNIGKLKVKPMPLTITADAKTRTFGETNPAFSWTKTALKNNDSIKQVSISTTAGPRSPIGTYDIVPSATVFENGKASNYLITYSKGILTVTESPIQICLVTIDMESGNSMVVWERNNTAGLKGYNVYRQTSSVGEYEKVGNVPISKTGIFVDSTSAIENHAELYKITTIDANSVESKLDQCNYHKSLFLQYTGSVGGVNLTWQPYEIENSVINFKSYIIYKGSDSSKLTVVDTVASNIYNFTDNDPLSLVYKYYYRIAGVKYTACYPEGHRKAGAGPFLESISNMEDNRLKASQGMIYTQKYAFDLVVSPNPVKNISAIRYILPVSADVNAQVINLLGETVANIKVGTQPEGNAQFYLDINKYRIAEGIYYLKVKAGNYEAVAKISVVK